MTDTIQLPDGIYFNLPDEIYHGQDRLSSSRIKDLIVSPATFWAKSWMNPKRKEKQGDHFTVGKAYHTARLEPLEFNNRFVMELDPDDYEIKTHAGIKRALKEIGEPQTKAGENALDAALRLRGCGYDDPIYHIDLMKWEAERKDRLSLSPTVWDEVIDDMRLLQGNKEASVFLKDGAPEVSFLWTDEDGIKWKVRFDWLATTHFSDFKTFVNSNGKKLDQCIADAFRFNGYYIQAYLYWSAMEEIRKGEHEIYHFNNNDPVPEIPELMKNHPIIDGIRAQKSPLKACYIFQEKGGIPNLLAREIEIFRQEHDSPKPTPSLLMRKAEIELNYAVLQYKQCIEIFGTDGRPWEPLNPVGTIGDVDYPSFWLEE